jgi:hypothetical protein
MRNTETKFTTTEGRRQFPELVVRTTYGHDIVIFDRHGRTMCALVPIEVLEMLLLGEDSSVDEQTKDKIRASSKRALEELYGGTTEWHHLLAKIDNSSQSRRTLPEKTEEAPNTDHVVPAGTFQPEDEAGKLTGPRRRRAA